MLCFLLILLLPALPATLAGGNLLADGHDREENIANTLAGVNQAGTDVMTLLQRYTAGFVEQKLNSAHVVICPCSQLYLQIQHE